MSYNHASSNILGMKILWSGLVLVVASLFVLLSGNGTHGAKTPESWSSLTVVNATNSDGSEETMDSDQADRQREIQNLHQKVRALEAEVATLKRQNLSVER
jgi:cell division protein FtsB